MNPGLADGDSIESLIAPLRALAQAERLWRPVAVPRGTQLMTEGAAAPSVFVLEHGLVKLAYATRDGGERIKSFIADRGIFGPGLGEADGRFSATTLEPSSTVALPATWLAARIGERDALQKPLARFVACVGARKQARERTLLCDSAETRLRDFVRDQPALAARLRQADIARFIGVTPIALSRIKRRIVRDASPAA